MCRYIVILFIMLAASACAQEFETYENDLIYSKETMGKLRHIADSLNLKFRTCDVDRIYTSLPQAIAYKVSLDTGDIKAAKRDMDNDISPADFAARYPLARINENVLVLKYRSVKYKYGTGVDAEPEEKPSVAYDEVSMRNDWGEGMINREDDGTLYEQKVAGKWVYDYYPGGEYVHESLTAFYFPSDFEQKQLPFKYARRIGYAQCLIDTGTAKIKKDADYGRVSLPRNWRKLPLKQQKLLLDSMRMTRVIGTCSYDGAPRIHAFYIALLAAETTNWEVFLKAHLDVLNDRFERVAYSSGAEQGYETYIRELEELNINVPDLLFGIAMRINNAPEEHYYGDVGRLARAISESKDKEIFEQEMLAMAGDEQLDDYNRAIGYFWYSAYLYYTGTADDKGHRVPDAQKLLMAQALLPAYMQEQMK